MHKNGLRLRLLAKPFSLALAVTVLFVSAMTFAGVQVRAASVSDLQDQLEDLEKERDQLNADIKDVQNDISKQQEYHDMLKQKVQVAQREVDLLNQKVEAINAELAKTQDQKAQKEAEIEENFDLFKQRIRAMYVQGNTSQLELLLTSQDFYDFLVKAQMVKSVAEHDRELIDELVAQKTELDEMIAKIETDKADLETAKQQSERAKAELENAVSESNDKLSELQALENSYKQDKQKVDQEFNAIDKKIQELLAQSEMDEYVGGEFGWPVPGYTTITSPFGWRFNHTDFHRGVDIGRGNKPSIYGATVVAANSGKVVASLLSTNPYGYGNYVLIDHGGGKATLYAHLSQRSVQVGQTVSKGQKIGEVGNTGYSFGPHLHFEIRINGTAVNPMSYYQMQS